MEPSTVVARVPVTGETLTVEAASILGISPGDLQRHMVKAIGEQVSSGECLAACKGWMGLVVYVARSPVAGVIRDVCPITGSVTIEVAEESVEVPASLPGVVAEVWPGRGVVVQSEGVLVEGVFGAGGFAWGRLATAGAVKAGGLAGLILAVDTLDGREDIQLAAAGGATAIVAWSATCLDITSVGDLPPLVVAGGFGHWPPCGFAGALSPAAGLWAAVNGVSFPDCLFIAGEPGEGVAPAPSPAHGAAGEWLGNPPGILPSGEGATVRLTAGPLAGCTGRLQGFAPGLHALSGGPVVRAARVLVDGGREVLVPVQNLEIAGPEALLAKPHPPGSRKRDPEP
ncbi:MAG: hypothetical protein ACM3X4_03640 [Ignavibacteriales bacterium]